MIYTKQSRHGDIGEHLVAFRVMKMIQWPCRLYGIDLGVDAEVEILNEDGIATGDLIKLQIKSIESMNDKDTFSAPTSPNHIEYWKRFSSPIVFCSVDLEKEEVYWKQITALDVFDTKGASKKVTFSKAADRLTEQTKQLWLALASPDEAHQLAELMPSYLKFLASTAGTPVTPSDCHSYEDQFAEAELIRGKIDHIIALIPWKISGEHLSIYRNAQDTLRRRKIQTEHDYVEIRYN